MYLFSYVIQQIHTFSNILENLWNENKTILNLTLSAWLQWCGSQTPKDTPVPGNSHSLTACLFGDSKIVCSRDEKFLTFGMHLLSSLWESSRSRFREIVPSVLIFADHQQKTDAVPSKVANGAGLLSLCNNTIQHRAVQNWEMRKGNSAALTNHFGRWHALELFYLYRNQLQSVFLVAGNIRPKHINRSCTEWV